MQSDLEQHGLQDRANIKGNVLYYDVTGRIIPITQSAINKLEEANAQINLKTVYMIWDRESQRLMI
jgi:hypothetical protein